MADRAPSIKNLLKYFSHFKESDPTFNVVEYNEEFEGFGKLNKRDKEGVIGFCKKGLLPEEFSIWDIDTRSKEYLKEFDGFISDGHWAALNISIQITKYSKENKLGKAKLLKRTLNEQFEEDGKRIYNLLESGFFDSLFYVLLKQIKSQYKDLRTAQRKFNEIFKDVLKWCPFAIWIKEYSVLKDIQIQVLQRIVTKGVPTLFLIAHGKKAIIILDNLIEYFSTEDWKEFDINTRDYDLRKIPSKRAIIYKLPHPTDSKIF